MDRFTLVSGHRAPRNSEDRTYREIAANDRYTVKTSKFHARRRLKALLADRAEGAT